MHTTLYIRWMLPINIDEKELAYQNVITLASVFYFVEV